MKEEIKEILNRLDFNEWEVDLYKVPITWCELYDIRDYITNLQEENEKIRKMNMYKHKYGSDMEGKYIIEKAKNKKAIEYIKEHYYEMIFGGDFVVKSDELLNILNGGDDNGND